jgi:hypothetical protein
MDDARYVIGSVPKNYREDVQVALTEFRGTALIDVRIHGDFDGAGKKRPCHKGVSLRVKLLPELVDLLQRALAEAQRRGLVSGGAE